MNKGAYEIIRLLIQSVDQEIKLDFADGTSRTIPVNPEKLLTELDKAQKLEQEANWLAANCHDFCYNSRDCNACILYPTNCPIVLDIKNRFDKYSVSNWREAARRAVEEGNE